VDQLLTCVDVPDAITFIFQNYAGS